MDHTTIHSVQNQRVKDAVKLREARQRAKQGRILIDGARELERAIRAGVKLEELFVCEALCDTPEAIELLRTATSSAKIISHVTPAVFAKLAFGERAEGVLGIASTPERRLADLRLPNDPLVAVLEGIEKPGNLGAVMRSADGAGISAVIVADGCTDLFNPNAIRASLGTIFTVPVCAASSAEALAWLRASGLRMFAARVGAKLTYSAADYRGPAAMILGSEASGLTEAWQAPDITPIQLPMLGAADSLNLSATAAILFYEALRQRS
jgi:TrmH family RNA methyltransferase